MKTYALKFILAALFITLFALTSCEDTTSNLLDSAPDEKIEDTNPTGLTFIEFKRDRFALAKTSEDKQLITADQGGRLKVTHNWWFDRDDNRGEKNNNDDDYSFKDDVAYKSTSSIKVTLDILPQALDEDTYLSLFLNESTIGGNVDMTFGPHGTQFNVPAVLNIFAFGLDLSGIDPKTIDIYYHNEEESRWEKMPSDGVYVYVPFGMIIVKNALLPHFSRYAVAYGN